MKEVIQNNKMIVGAALVLGVIGVGFAGMQTNILSAASEEPQSQPSDSAEPGQAMQAQEDLGEDSAQSGDAMELDRQCRLRRI
ncbi:MAG: hypothetical protein J07AB43_05290 [Candidatus Nanosalina sp. J07AB43]|nr:MAG: hypothetical protein J07AB43_05290 [Candidatus Nanosalina sp. J07AB43]